MPKPVLVLLRHSLLLKASAATCQKNPKPKPVHKLRSSMRRLEATLELLAITSGISGLRKQSVSLRRSFRKIRHAAGEVRDLDVLRELAASYKTPDAKQLEQQLAAARDKAAEQLHKRLDKDTLKTHQTLDDLEAVLEPALDANLGGNKLAETARSVFAKAVKGFDPNDDDQLHAIRKASKRARYIAEIGGKSSKQAAATTTHFEDIQQTLGAWHDHLMLLEKAQGDLKKSSPLLSKIDADTNRLRQRALLKAQKAVAGA